MSLGCDGRRTNSMICVLIKKWKPYNFYQKRGSSLAELGSSRPQLGSLTKNLWHRFVQNLGIAKFTMGFWIPYFRTHSLGIENPRIIISWVDGWVDDIPVFADCIPMLFGLVETCQTLTLAVSVTLPAVPMVMQGQFCSAQNPLSAQYHPHSLQPHI